METFFIIWGLLGVLSIFLRRTDQWFQLTCVGLMVLVGYAIFKIVFIL